MSHPRCTVDLMWVPTTADELLAAIPGFEETASLEAKREFPAPGKNDDLAVDVAAMSVDGGTIIYGISEDKSTGTFSAQPIPLAGLVERLTSVVRSKVAGSLTFDATALRSDDDAELGYLVVSVPPSPAAPHMVESKGEMRFYGRGPGGNILLTQGDIDRLYERRQRTYEERLAKFTDWLEQMPPNYSSTFYLMIRPLMGDSGLLERAWPENQEGQIFPAIQQARAIVGGRFQLGIGLDLVFTNRIVRTLTGFRLANSDDESIVLTITVDEDGTMGCSLQGVARSVSTAIHDFEVFEDRICAQIGAQLICMAGNCYERAGYFGSVDLSFEVRGHEGATGADWLFGNMIPPATGYPAISGPLRGDLRTSASSLMGSGWAAVSGELFRRMFEVVGPPRRPDIFPG